MAPAALTRPAPIRRTGADQAPRAGAAGSALPSSRPSPRRTAARPPWNPPPATAPGSASGSRQPRPPHPPRPSRPPRPARQPRPGYPAPARHPTDPAAVPRPGSSSSHLAAPPLPAAVIPARPPPCPTAPAAAIRLRGYPVPMPAATARTARPGPAAVTRPADHPAPPPRQPPSGQPRLPSPDDTAREAPARPAATCRSPSPPADACRTAAPAPEPPPSTDPAAAHPGPGRSCTTTGGTRRGQVRRRARRTVMPAMATVIPHGRPSHPGGSYPRRAATAASAGARNQVTTSGEAVGGPLAPRLRGQPGAVLTWGRPPGTPAGYGPVPPSPGRGPASAGLGR